MQKWKRNCRLRKMTLKNEQGISLVELLAALAIFSLVILLAGSIHIFGQKQFIGQTASANQANDLSYAMTIMSTDIRKESAENVTVSADGSEIRIADKTVYSYSGGSLLLNGTVLIGSVSSFSALKNEEEESLEIKISLWDQFPGVIAKNYQTKIYFRG